MAGRELNINNGFRHALRVTDLDEQVKNGSKTLFFFGSGGLQPEPHELTFHQLTLGVIHHMP